MPAATIIKTSLANPGQVSLANYLSTSMQSAGWTQVDSYATTLEFRVLRWTMSNATQGSIWCQIQVASNGQLGANFGNGWNSVARTLSNSINVGTGNASTGTVTLYATSVNHPEFKGILIEQGSTQRIIGVLRPNNSPPSWWDENSFPFGFPLNYSSTLGNNNATAVISPFGTGLTFPFLLSSALQDGISIASDTRSILPLIVLNNGTSGVVSACTDVVICASNTMRNLDTITVSASEIYTYFWGNLNQCGLAIRTT